MRLSLLSLLCLWIEIENVSSVDYLTQANKDQLLLGFCYFLCCVFNVCKLGRASRTAILMVIFIEKSAYYTRVNTVIPCRKGGERRG